MLSICGGVAMRRSGSMEPWFKGKVALVTGGGDGIGRATSLLFARRGAAGAVTDIRSDAAQSTADMILAEGGRAFAMYGDVTDDQVVAAFVGGTIDKFGRIDCAF